MILPRWRGLVLFTVTALAAAVATYLILPPAGARVVSGARQRWDGLSRAEQLSYVEQYQALRARPDYVEALRQARLYAALPPAEQQVLRRLNQEMQETIENQPAATRRHLLALPPRPRADELYRLLQREAPQRLLELRHLVARP